jgi:DNA-binding transcriptional ArsR family regulator
MKNLWIFEKNRLLILKALFSCENHLCGSDFIDTLDIPKSLVSYHLKALRENGFVSEQPSGRNKNYQLNPERIDEVVHILKAVGL